MTDIFTYIFYLSLLFFLVISTYYLKDKKLKGKKYYDPNDLNILYVLIVIVISFFVGIRFEVGNDWDGYVTDFLSLTSNSSFSYFDQYYELGYYTLNWLVGVLNLGYQWVFFSSAIIAWYFYFKSVPRYIIPLFIFFIFTDEFFFSGMNLVRQFTAMALWVFSVKFIIDRNLKLFLLSIIGASLFHSSSLLLIPFYFIPYEKLYNQIYWMIIYGVSLIAVFFLDLSTIYQNLDLLVLALSDDIGTVERYARYAESGRLAAEETSLGLGFTFKLLVNFLIIMLSKSWIKRRPELKPYLVLFFIGAILFNIFYEFQLIGRLTNYFLIFRPLVLAYIIYFYWVFKKDRIIGPFIIFLYFLILLAAIYGSSNMCCPYQFHL
ncbi:EpsG family protein [Gracilimonas halophila]|uniref:EpsG family protein n=1 Tax=Gracilimonas halophila TaxID=1834464 RepID=A0ABW5JLI1_9BACT